MRPTRQLRGRMAGVAGRRSDRQLRGERGRHRGRSAIFALVNQIVELAASAGDSCQRARIRGRLSGGIDSAVVARLCQLAAPGQVAAVIMPCRSDPQDEADAISSQIHSRSRPSGSISKARTMRSCPEARSGSLDCRRRCVHAATRQQTRVALGNVRPRLRMTVLYYLANSLNYLVAGTGNRSELTIGYFTKHGDGGVDVLPLGHLLKSEVRTLARSSVSPSRSSTRRRAPGLWLGQTDEAEMGFSYADLERYLTNGPEGVSPALALRLERIVRATEHKRTLPPTPES